MRSDVPDVPGSFKNAGCENEMKLHKEAEIAAGRSREKIRWCVDRRWLEPSQEWGRRDIRHHRLTPLP
jgi:hypothetical protein